jgi:nuclear transcription factor Y gamma
LSRSDIAKALSKSDQFDFLIDIVPRDELPFPSAGTGTTNITKKLSSISTLQHDAGSDAPPSASMEIDKEGSTAGNGSEVMDQVSAENSRGVTMLMSILQLEYLGNAREPEVS